MNVKVAPAVLPKGLRREVERKMKENNISYNFSPDQPITVDLKLPEGALQIIAMINPDDFGFDIPISELQPQVFVELFQAFQHPEAKCFEATTGSIWWRSHFRWGNR